MIASKPPAEKQPEQSEESDERPAINLYCVNPETGERTLAAQTPRAKALQDLSSQDLQQTEPPTPPH